MEQTKLKDDKPYCTDMPVGEILRRTRVHYGQSLADVESSLRIRASMIEAIETGAMEKLPGRVYAIGFVRSYAEHLGLDVEKIVLLFKAQMDKEAKKPELSFPVAASESRVPSLVIVVLSLLACFLIIGFWWSYQRTDRSMVEEIPSAPVVEAVSYEAAAGPSSEGALPLEGAAAVDGAPSDALQSPAGPEAVVAEEEPLKGIILNITQNSWVEIRDSAGKVILSQVLKEGDQYSVPDRPDLTMSLGNAGGVAIEVDGLAIEFLGKKGQVRRDIPLDAALLKTRYGAEPDASKNSAVHILQNTVDNPVE